MPNCPLLRFVLFFLLLQALNFDSSLVNLFSTSCAIADAKENLKKEETGDSANDLDFDESIFGAEYRPEAESQAQSDIDYRFGGFVKGTVAYGFYKDPPRFTKLKTDLNLFLDYRIAAHWKLRCEGEFFYDAAYLAYNRDQFDSKTLDENEADAR